MLSLFLATSVTAETSRVSVRAALDQGDIAALERLMADLHQRARSSTDWTELRQIHIDLIATTHPHRSAVIEAWRQRYPRSVYAAAAVAHMVLKHHDILVARGAQALLKRDTPERAAEAAVDAVFAGPHYVPALEAWLALPGRERGTRLERLIETRLMQTSPDRASLHAILKSKTTPTWRNATNQVVEACVEHAGNVQGYNAEICIAEAAMTLNGLGELRPFAVEYIRNSVDPLLNEARMRAAVQNKIDVPQEALQAWLEMGPATDDDAVRHAGLGSVIEYRLGLEGAHEAARNRALAYINRRLRDDPLNQALILEKVRILYLRFTETRAPGLLAQARSAWPDARPFAGSSPRFWEYGALLEGADRHVMDVRSRMPYRETAIVMSEHNSYSIMMYFVELRTAYEAARSGQFNPALARGAAEHAGRIAQDLRCPLLRAARLADAICQVNGRGGTICDPNEQFFEHVPATLRLGHLGLCDAVQKTPISALKYQETPNAMVPLLQN